MKTKSRITPLIRWTSHGDVADLVDIELESFHGPWPEDVLRTELARPGVNSAVAEHGGFIVGYLLYELHPDCVEILRFATTRDHRRLGVATALLSRLGSKLGKLPFSSVRRTHASACVPESYTEGLVFLRKLGYRGTLLKGRYGPDEDGILMILRPKEGGDQ